MNSVWNSCHLFFVLKTDGNLELVDVRKALFFAVFGQSGGGAVREGSHSPSCSLRGGAFFSRVTSTIPSFVISTTCTLQ